MRLRFVRRGLLVGILALGVATSSEAAVYAFSGVTTLPSYYGEGPHAAGVAAALGVTADSVVSYSLTIADETHYVGANYRNYFASAFSLMIDGVEVIKTSDPFSDAYVLLSSFDEDGDEYDADIMFMDIRRSNIAGLGPELVDLQFHMRFAAVFGTFGPEFALPTSTSFLASARPADAAHTEIFGYNTTGDHFDTFSVHRVGVPSTFLVTEVTPAAAPEPTAWALLVLGFWLAGRALRGALRPRVYTTA